MCCSILSIYVHGCICLCKASNVGNLAAVVVSEKCCNLARLAVPKQSFTNLGMPSLRAPQGQRTESWRVHSGVQVTGIRTQPEH